MFDIEKCLKIINKSEIKAIEIRDNKEKAINNQT